MMMRTNAVLAVAAAGAGTFLIAGGCTNVTKYDMRRAERVLAANAESVPADAYRIDGWPTTSGELEWEAPAAGTVLVYWDNDDVLHEGGSIGPLNAGDFVRFERNNGQRDLRLYEQGSGEHGHQTWHRVEVYPVAILFFDPS